MPEPREPPELDEAVMAGIMAGYLRYAIAQKSRFEAAGEEPPVTEAGNHNRFLWCRIRYPGFFRHVAREMDSPKFNDRIVAIATAAATTALKERPTLQDWTRAMGESWRHGTVAKYQQRLAGEYAPDAIRIHGAEGLPDERMRVLSTSFDPLTGYAVRDVVPIPELDLETWKNARHPSASNLQDWVTVSSALHAVYPEQLRVWMMVYKAVRDCAATLGSPPASRTVAFPTMTNVIANHAASMCADTWWIQRQDSVKHSLLNTPRVFEYSDEDARAAAYVEMSVDGDVRSWPACHETGPSPVSSCSSMAPSRSSDGGRRHRPQSSFGRQAACSASARWSGPPCCPTPGTSFAGRAGRARLPQCTELPCP